MDNSVKVIDVRGRCCPIPIIEAKRAMGHCVPGSSVRILATDVGFPKDLEAFCRQTGHQIIESDSMGGEYSYLVQRHL